jgi:S1-C subfamily serine protease
MKTGSHHRVAARVLAAVPATALATGLILVLGAPSSSGSGTSGQGSGLVPFPAARPAQVASTERGIIARVKPGVVIIDTRLQYDSEAAAGTGMVINPDGLVLTNNHVIEDATSITATVAGKTYQARVAGYDKTDDIALLRLQGAPRLPAPASWPATPVARCQAPTASSAWTPRPATPATSRPPDSRSRSTRRCLSRDRSPRARSGRPTT